MRLQAAGMGGPGLAPPAGKRVRWHVDYLLDRPEVTLTHILAVRSLRPLEATLAQRLNGDPCTVLIAPGLGASDSAAPTHLLHLDAPAGWWEALVDEFTPLPPR
jgi:Uri superfamily endonuclease